MDNFKRDNVRFSLRNPKSETHEKHPETTAPTTTFAKRLFNSFVSQEWRLFRQCDSSKSNDDSNLVPPDPCPVSPPVTIIENTKGLPHGSLNKFINLSPRNEFKN